jgi:hypothetical protein
MPGSEEPPERLLDRGFVKLVLVGVAVAAILGIWHTIAHVVDQGAAATTSTTATTTARTTTSMSRTATTAGPSTGSTTSSLTTATVSGVQTGLTGCFLTFKYGNFASVYDSPSPSAATIGTVPSGTYESAARDLVNWGGKGDWWYEISVNGSSGWVENDGVQISSVSSACIA